MVRNRMRVGCGWGWGWWGCWCWWCCCWWSLCFLEKNSDGDRDDDCDGMRELGVLALRSKMSNIVKRFFLGPMLSMCWFWCLDFEAPDLLRRFWVRPSWDLVLAITFRRLKGSTGDANIYIYMQHDSWIKYAIQSCLSLWPPEKICLFDPCWSILYDFTRFNTEKSALPCLAQLLEPGNSVHAARPQRCRFGWNNASISNICRGGAASRPGFRAKSVPWSKRLSKHAGSQSTVSRCIREKKKVYIHILSYFTIK